MTDPAENLLNRQAGVRATARTQAVELLWQRRGQPADQAAAHQELVADAEAVARMVFEIVVGEADLFASGGERLAAALKAIEDCRARSCSCWSSSWCGAAIRQR
jgi:hypothetical protein